MPRRRRTALLLFALACAAPAGCLTHNPSYFPYLGGFGEVERSRRLCRALEVAVRRAGVSLVYGASVTEILRDDYDYGSSSRQQSCAG